MVYELIFIWLCLIHLIIQIFSKKIVIKISFIVIIIFLLITLINSLYDENYYRLLYIFPLIFSLDGLIFKTNLKVDDDILDSFSTLLDKHDLIKTHLKYLEDNYNELNYFQKNEINAIQNYDKEIKNMVKLSVYNLKKEDISKLISLSNKIIVKNNLKIL